MAPHMRRSVYWSAPPPVNLSILHYNFLIISTFGLSSSSTSGAPNGSKQKERTEAVILISTGLPGSSSRCILVVYVGAQEGTRCTATRATVRNKAGTGATCRPSACTCTVTGMLPCWGCNRRKRWSNKSIACLRLVSPRHSLTAYSPTSKSAVLGRQKQRRGLRAITGRGSV